MRRNERRVEPLLWLLRYAGRPNAKISRQTGGLARPRAEPQRAWAAHLSSPLSPPLFSRYGRAAGTECPDCFYGICLAWNCSDGDSGSSVAATSRGLDLAREEQSIRAIGGSLFGGCDLGSFRCHAALRALVHTPVLGSLGRKRGTARAHRY